MALRDQHLGHFAEICHINPRELDEQRMRDFARLVLFIEQILEARKRAQSQ